MARKCYMLIVISAAASGGGGSGWSAEMLVSDRSDGRILRYNSTSGSFIGELIGPANPLSASDLDDPAAMAVGNGGALFVASRGNGKVLEFDANTGQYRGEFATGLMGPSGLAVDRVRNQLWVSELGNFDSELIKRFDLNTGQLLGEVGSGTGPFGRTDLAFGPDGLLYAGSFYDGRIVRFDPDSGQPSPSQPGETTGTFAAGGEGFLGTNGLAFVDDRLLAVGLLSFSVFQFESATGASLGELIPAATGGLFFPADLVVGRDGSVLVSSLGNDDPTNGLPLGPGYIGKYDLETGELVNPFFIAGAGGLVQPSAMVLLPSELMPGDADQDLDFDQLDLVMVQVAGKYMTSQAATWGEGDWDGAPGGSPGEPPMGDGLFDSRDIVAALAGGKYATGPYAAGAHSYSDSGLTQGASSGETLSLGLAYSVGSRLNDMSLRQGVLAWGLDAAAGTGDAGLALVPVPEPASCLLLAAGLLWIPAVRAMCRKASPCRDA